MELTATAPGVTATDITVGYSYLDFDELVVRIRDTYDARNKPPFEWADG